MKRSLVSGFWSKIEEFRRVLKISRKPTLEEIKRASKVSFVGILIVGMIGFILQLLFLLIR